MEPYYGDDGTLYVWTGTGYHAIPKIAAGDVGERVVNSYADENSSTGYGLNPTSSYTDGYEILDPAKYGLPDHWNNFLGGGVDQNSLSYLLKSGDKVGSQIGFERDGDFYNPTFAGLQPWDTNDGKDSWLPLGIMLGGAGLLAAGASGVGAGLGLTNSMTGAGGTALAGSADAALWGGLGGSAAGAAGTGLTLTGSAINPATYSMTPSAMMGDGLLASGIGGAAGSAGGLSGLWDKIPGALQSQLIKGGMTLAGGLLGGGGESSGGSGMAPGPRSIAPAITPKMYGEGASTGVLGASMGPMGPTETERRMRQQYMPSLLGGQNPWGY